MKMLKSVTIFMYILLLPALIRAEEAVTSPWTAYRNGVDSYHQQDYDQAAADFLKALNTADQTLEQWASYNLGNTSFKKARALEKQDPAAALNNYQEALEYFRRAITTDQRDKDAKINYELTANKVKELEQQQKQNEQKQQNKQDKKNSGKDQNDTGDKNNQADKDKEQNQQKEEQQDKQTKPGRTDNFKEQDKGQAKPEQQQKMSKDEALMLLNNFQRSEEKPKALLRQKEQGKPTEVDKDW